MPLLNLEFDRLLAVFRRAVLLAGSVASLVLSGCGSCAPYDQIFLLREPDAATQTLIDRCRDPIQPDCLPLCRHVTGIPGGNFAHCELHPDRDGYMAVHVGARAVCSSAGGRRPSRLTSRQLLAQLRRTLWA